MKARSAVVRSAVIITVLLLVGCKSAPTAATSESVRPVDCHATTGAFVNRPFAPQTGKFVAELDARVSGLRPESEAAIGLSKGPGEGYGSMGSILYFKKDGFFGARKSREETSSVKMAYSPNLLYHVRLEVDVPGNQYSVFITPPGAKEETLATNYAFRQSGDTPKTWSMFDNWRLIAYPSGTKLEVCDFKVSEVK